MRKRLLRARKHWRLGRIFEYPTCCIVRFIVDSQLGRQPGTLRKSTSPNTPGDNSGWVPCGIWHHTHPTWKA